VKKNTSNEIYSISLNKSNSMRLAVYGTILMFLSISLFNSIFSTESGALSLSLLVVYLLTLVIHELIHGLFFKLFKGSPTFGVGVQYFMPYAYASSVGDKFTYRQMSVIGLSPFVLISAATLLLGFIIPAWVPYLAVAFVGNFSGAVGDLWMWTKLQKFRGISDVLIEDQAKGLAVYSDNNSAAEIARKMTTKEEKLDHSNNFTSTWLRAFFGFLVLAMFAPLALSTLGFGGNVQIGPDWLPLVSYIDNLDTKEFSLEINFLGPIIAGLMYSILRVKLFQSKDHTETN